MDPLMTKKAGRHNVKKGCHPKYNTPRYWKKPDCKWGERNPNRKLSWADIGVIREAPKGYGNIKKLSLHFGIAKSGIREIRRGARWIFGRTSSDYAENRAAGK